MNANRYFRTFAVPKIQSSVTLTTPEELVNFFSWVKQNNGKLVYIGITKWTADKNSLQVQNEAQYTNII